MTTKKTVRKKAVKRREIEKDEDCDCGCEGKSKAGRKFWIALTIAAVGFALLMAFWLHEGTEADQEVNPWNWD